jgi:hypothetical protein
MAAAVEVDNQVQLESAGILSRTPGAWIPMLKLAFNGGQTGFQTRQVIRTLNTFRWHTIAIPLPNLKQPWEAGLPVPRLYYPSTSVSYTPGENRKAADQ